MKPCKSLNAFFDGEFKTPMVEQMRRVTDGGFVHVDMNFWDWCHDERSPFRKDDWRDWVKQIDEDAKRMGAVFTQAHAHVYSFYQGQDCIHEEMIRRSIEGAGMLNIPWIVVHPSVAPDTEFAKTVEDNAEYFTRHAERAAQWGVGLAIENMGRESQFRSAEALCTLVDKINMPNVGICWDTGHANLSKQDQPASIRAMGKRLHALHVADNFGEHDDHMPPYFGNIEWAPIMAALREIAYDGDFTFEGHMLVRKMPDWAKAEAIKLQYRIGCGLVEIV